MITKISGRLVALGEEAATLSVGAFEYEVLVTDYTRRQMQAHVGQEVTLHTIDYLDGNPMHGRLTPRLIGFVNEIEREFFEVFCSVDGVGVKKALRAMVRPVPDVAEAIEQQDAKTLATLPGVGPALAERVIAKLRRKMPKFALMVARDLPVEGDVSRDVVRDAFEVLCALGHAESEARRLLDATLAGKKRKFAHVNDLISAVYDQSHRDETG